MYTERQVHVPITLFRVMYGLSQSTSLNQQRHYVLGGRRLGM